MATVLEQVEKARAGMAKSDAKRDAGLTVPQGLTLCKDIVYGPNEDNILDVYYPEATTAPLPTIISIHGGGWIYGDKELYSHYCMRLAGRGFAVVNFNYRLAPEHPYPAGLSDCCQVLHWVQQHGREYQIDCSNLFMVGDSAGGQLAYQLLTMLTSPEYASLFDFRCPENLKIRACGLNCGCYFLPFDRFLPPKLMGYNFVAYLPGDYMKYVPQLKTSRYLTRDFPPTFVMSAQNDFLKFMAKPLHKKLQKAGAKSILKIYGTKAQKEIGHVFHVNCYLDMARQCNDEQCDFFRAHMA